MVELEFLNTNNKPFLSSVEELDVMILLMGNDF